jgi:hypothetical protein
VAGVVVGVVVGVVIGVVKGCWPIYIDRLAGLGDSCLVNIATAA